MRKIDSRDFELYATAYKNSEKTNFLTSRKTEHVEYFFPVESKLLKNGKNFHKSKKQCEETNYMYRQ